MPAATSHAAVGTDARPWLRHPLTWVVVFATVVRVIAIAGLSVSLGYSDSNSYIGLALGEPGLGISPPGYPLFLRALHDVSHSVDLVLVVQHGLVVLGGVALYRAARDLACGVGVATAAAAVFMLCGNLLGSAHGILTESTFAVLVTFALAAAVRASTTASLPAFAALGTAIGLATTIRAIGLPLGFVLTLMLLLALRPWRADAVASWKGVIARGATVTAGLVASVATVALLAGSTTALPLVGSSSAGWLLYGRVAQFADCPATYAPAKLRYLCPAEPEIARQGPDYWRIAGGPAKSRFGGIPNGDAVLQEFAIDVIKHQPLDYAKAVFVDTMRFFAPNFGRERGYSGAGWDELELDRRLDPASEAYNKGQVERWYSDYHERSGARQLIARYQEATTLTAGWWAVLMLLALVAPFVTIGRQRFGAMLAVAGGVVLLVEATAFNMYVARYALPALAFLLLGSALAAEGLARRIVRAAPMPDAEPTPSTATASPDAAVPADRRCIVCGEVVRVKAAPWSAQCPACGTWTSTLEPRVNSELHESIDTEARTEGLQTLRERNNAAILDAIAELRPAEQPRILDVGPAHGWFMETATARGLTIEGVEPEETLAASARERGLAVRTGYFPAALAPDERYDVIAFNDVLEHIPDARATLQACAGHLTAGGVLSINIPNAGGLAYRVASALKRVGVAGPYERLWQYGLPSPHVHYFPTSALVRLVEDNGLEVRTVRALSSIERRGLWARVHTIRRVSPASIASFCALWLAAPVLNRPRFSDIVLVLAQPKAAPSAGGREAESTVAAPA